MLGRAGRREVVTWRCGAPPEAWDHRHQAPPSRDPPPYSCSARTTPSDDTHGSSSSGHILSPQKLEPQPPRTPGFTRWLVMRAKFPTFAIVESYKRYSAFSFRAMEERYRRLPEMQGSSLKLLCVYLYLPFFQVPDDPQQPNKESGKK